MIRRGLQVFCGWAFLGAASCFGQQTVYPTQMTLQDFTNSAVNGLYVPVGEVASGSYGSVFQRYSADQSVPLLWATAVVIGTNSFVNVHTNYPTDFTPVLYNSQIIPSSEFQSTYGFFRQGSQNVSGTALLSFEPPPSPYEEAFPDWESAAVKIPLGFSFAMAFWAGAVVLTIGMRWVKDLASAAS